MQLHERTGVVVEIDRGGHPVVQFDDVTKCCGHPSCGVRKPEARTQIMWAGRDVVEGARVVTFWHKTTTAGGLVAVALDVPRGTAEGSAA